MNPFSNFALKAKKFYYASVSAIGLVLLSSATAGSLADSPVANDSTAVPILSSDDPTSNNTGLPSQNFTYDVAGQLIKETVSNGVSDEISAGAAYTSTYAYDQQYNRKETSHSELKEINTPVTASADTEYSPPEAETSPTLSDTPQAETEEASHESSTKPEGISENTSRIEETILPEKRTYYPTGLLKTLQQGGGPEIEFGHDGFKRLTSLVFPALTSPANMPNASPASLGLPEAESVPSEASTPEASLVIPISPPRPYEAYAYDAQDRLTVKQTRAKEQIQFQYDALGRKTAESIFDSKNNLVYQTSTQYDATGRPTCMVRLLSNYLSYTPTIALPVSSNTHTENSSSASSDTTTVFALAPPVDMPTGSPLATPPAASSEAAPLASAPFATALPTETPAANKATGGGIEASLPYFSTISLCFVYDSLGRLIGEQQIGRSLQEAASIVDSAQGEGATQEPSNLLSEGAEATSTGRGVIGPLDLKQTPLNVSWELDKNNNRTSLTWPATNESVESTPYKVLYAYDSLNRLKEVKESTGHVLGTYAYDSFSQRTQTTLGDSSLNLTYTYGTNGQVEILKNKWKNGKLDQNFGYDANLQQISRTTSDPRFLPSHIKTQNEQLIANALNQYTEITKTAGDKTNEEGVKQTLTYDLDGNLHSYDGWTYKHNALGQLVEAWRGKDSERIHIIYTYDMLGRRSSKTVNGVTTYTVWAGNQEIGEYDRDWKLLKRYVYGPGLDEPLARIDASGERHYFMTDKLGSVIGLVKDQGELVEKHAYTAFGVEVTRGENDPQEGIVLGEQRFCAADVAQSIKACRDPEVVGLLAGASATDIMAAAHKSPHLYDTGSAFRFAGRRYDPETGLYYNRARYYSPMLGRFLEPDPIGVAGGLNLYAYANNNPINYTDPMGTCPNCISAGIGAVYGGLSAYLSDPQNATWQSVMAGAVVGGVVGFFGGWGLNAVALPQSGALVPAATAVARAGIHVASAGSAGGLGSALGDYVSTGAIDWTKAGQIAGITAAMPLITGETVITAMATGLSRGMQAGIEATWAGFSVATGVGLQYGATQAAAERQTLQKMIREPLSTQTTPRK